MHATLQSRCRCHLENADCGLANQPEIYEASPSLSEVRLEVNSVRKSFVEKRNWEELQPPFRSLILLQAYYDLVGQVEGKTCRASGLRVHGTAAFQVAFTQNASSAEVISWMIFCISGYAGWNGVGLLGLPHSMV